MLRKEGRVNQDGVGEVGVNRNDLGGAEAAVDNHLHATQIGVADVGPI